jgi:hypothetical protein
MTVFKPLNTEAFHQIKDEIRYHEIKKNECPAGKALIPRLRCDNNCQFWIDGYGFTDWALDQLRSKLGISRFTLNSSVRKSYTALLPELTKDTVVTFLKYYQKQLLLRYGVEGDSGLRAVLSKNYSIYNNSQMMDMLEPHTKSNNKMYLLEYYVDDFIFSLKVLIHDFKIKGEDWWSGFRFANSEVGYSRIRMDLFFFKVVCTNGMIIPQSCCKLVNRIHFRIDSGKLENTVKKGFENGFKYSSDIKEKIEKSYDMKLDADKSKALTAKIENSLDRVNINMDVINKKMEKYPPNYYGYANAISEIAQGCEDNKGNIIKFPFWQRQFLDELAGNIIIMAA